MPDGRRTQPRSAPGRRSEGCRSWARSVQGTTTPRSRWVTSETSCCCRPWPLFLRSSCVDGRLLMRSTTMLQRARWASSARARFVSSVALCWPPVIIVCLCACNFCSISPQVCIMIHSGSRGLGHQVLFLLSSCPVSLPHLLFRSSLSLLLMLRWQPTRVLLWSVPWPVTALLSTIVRYAPCQSLVHCPPCHSMSSMPLHVPSACSRQLACARIRSPEGQDYLKAMSAAANYAWVNRSMMTFLTRQVRR